MAPKLVPGLYEKLITETLDRMLQGEFEAGFVERDELDRGDAHVLLARRNLVSVTKPDNALR